MVNTYIVSLLWHTSVTSLRKEFNVLYRVHDVTRGDNSLSVTLTRSNPLSGETAPFKVVTKVRTGVICGTWGINLYIPWLKVFGCH